MVDRESAWGFESRLEDWWWLDILPSWKDSRRSELDSLPHDLRLLNDGRGVIVRHPVNNSEELLARAGGTDGRISLLLDLDEDVVAVGLRSGNDCCGRAWRRGQGDARRRL